MASTQSSFPVIDVSSIDDPKAHLSISQELTSACSRWGFLLLKGHSIPQSSINNLFALSKKFFALCEEEKEPYPINSEDTGYMGSFRDSGKDDKMSMWFGGVPGSLSTTQKTSLPPFWHHHIAQVETFKRDCHKLMMKLLECFAIAMNLPDPAYFAKAHVEDSKHGNSLRSLMYPSRATKVETGGSRMRAHTDSGSDTLLFQQGPGLEVLSPSDEWVKAPCLDGHILVNLGDGLSFWSGGLLKATLHRVTFDTLPFNKERQSMAYFGKARSETILEPLICDDEVFAKQKYLSNGVEIQPGMTVGELNEEIMRRIYG